MDKNDNNNKKNMILLTIIAVVTMIVVVVGATFAYLASMVTDQANSNINVSTNVGSDLFLINPGTDLTLQANTTNFDENLAGSTLSNSSIASVVYSTTSEVENTINYKIQLVIESNDFEYSSGKCYNASSEDPYDESSYETCTGSGLVWGITDSDKTYKCYNPGTEVTNSFYNNEIACLSKKNSLWAKKKTPELIFELYKNDDSVTTQADCTSASGIWLTDDNMCLTLLTSKDVTEAYPVGGELTVDLLEEPIEISATNGTTTHYYQPIITLVNFEHNQIVNGSKNFKGKLEFFISYE